MFKQNRVQVVLHAMREQDPEFRKLTLEQQITRAGDYLRGGGTVPKLKPQTVDLRGLAGRNPTEKIAAWVAAEFPELTEEEQLELASKIRQGEMEGWTVVDAPAEDDTADEQPADELAPLSRGTAGKRVR